MSEWGMTWTNTTLRPLLWLLNLQQTTDLSSHNKNAKLPESDVTIHQAGDTTECMEELQREVEKWEGILES